jgi:hypothetical protein
MPRVSLIWLTIAALSVPAASAHADDTIATTVRATPVSAIGGRIVWSEYDPAADAYFLTQRFDGMTARLPVKPRAVPFDVDVGRNAANDTVAAYSRCRGEPSGRGPGLGNVFTLMPQWSTGRGCDVYVLNLRTNVEICVRGASSAGASEFLPTVWRGRIAFARVYERRRGRAGKRAYLFLRALTGGGTNRRVPAGPRSRGRLCAFSPPTCRRVVEPGPTGLDLSLHALAFGWDSAGRQGVTSGVYLERLRSGRIARLRVARGSSGEMQHREFMAPQIDAQNRLVWILSLRGDLTLSEVGRYTIRNGSRRVARLQPVGGDPVVRPAIAGAVEGSTAVYLASGLVPPEEQPCTLQSLCLAEPGCSVAQPCQLRLASGLRFTRPARR